MFKTGDYVNVCYQNQIRIHKQKLSLT